MDEIAVGSQVLRDKWGNVTSETKEFASGWTTLLCLWCAQVERLSSGDAAQRCQRGAGVARPYLNGSVAAVFQERIRNVQCTRRNRKRRA